jgi:general stress protein YciG
MKIHKKQGFAAISRERQKEIAAMGGRAVPAERRSFAQDKALAASAGKKGGKAVTPDKRSFSVDHELAKAAGRKGGKVTHAK